jgi:UDP-N-acetylmuramate dehydrogenase
MGVTIEKNASLKSYNTFGVDVNANSLAIIRDQNSLIDLIRNSDQEPWILGGGSNMLLTRDVDKLVLKIEIDGIDIEEETSSSVMLRVGAGVVWHDLVLWAVKRGYGGIENLALIPGRVGAAPIQNIGAYGVELKSVFHCLEAVELTGGGRSKLHNDACQFGYRDSIFKQSEKGKHCITHVYLKLNKAPHSTHADYGAIKSTLALKGISTPSIQDICDAVVSIRSEKLPDPADLGNSGSFFKNPVVSKSVWEGLIQQRADLLYYPAGENTYKLPAGWLIEQCGWKGKRIGNVGCYEKQALVIVNYGGASGQEILDHAMRVQASVEEEFGIVLSPEVNMF